MIIYNMPQAARAAFEQAHRQRGKRKTHNAGQAAQRDYRLTADYQAYLKDEREWREKRADDTAEKLAAQAANFLMSVKRPRLTARRLQIAQVAEGANKARIARARDPRRQRAAMVRHMNTVCYEILKERGLK